MGAQRSQSMKLVEVTRAKRTDVHGEVIRREWRGGKWRQTNDRFNLVAGVEAYFVISVPSFVPSISFIWRWEEVDLPKFKLRISKALGLDKQCAYVGITKFTTELAMRSFEAGKTNKQPAPSGVVNPNPIADCRAIGCSAERNIPRWRSLALHAALLMVRNGIISSVNLLENIKFLFLVVQHIINQKTIQREKPY